MEREFERIVKKEGDNTKMLEHNILCKELLLRNSKDCDI